MVLCAQDWVLRDDWVFFFLARPQIRHIAAKFDSLGVRIFGCFSMGNIFFLIYLNFPHELSHFQNLYIILGKKAMRPKLDVFLGFTITAEKANFFRNANAFRINLAISKSPLWGGVTPPRITRKVLK